MRTKQNAAFSAALFAVYAGWCIVLLFVHEPWRDEVQSWLLVRDLDFVTLLSQLRYDGHPAGWFLLLWPLAKLGLPFMAQRLLHMAIVLAAAGIVCFKARSTVFKLFILAATPLMYELSALSRNYAMSALALLIFAVFYKERFERGLLPACVCLFFLINSNIYGAIAGAALIGGEIVLLVSRRFHPVLRREASPQPLRAAAYFATAAVSFVCVYLIVFSDIFVRYNPVPLHAGAHFTIIQEYGFGFQRLADAFFRVGNASVLGALPAHTDFIPKPVITLGCTLLILCGIAGAVLTARKTASRFWIAAVCLCAYAGTVLALTVTGIFNIRHGVPFVFVLAASWFIALEERDTGPRISRISPVIRGLGVFAACVVFIGAFSLNVYRSALDVKRPYSTGMEAAAFLKDYGYDTDDTLILATGHPFVSTVLGFTENIKTFRYVYGDCSFALWQVYNSRYEHSFGLSEFIRQQAEAHRGQTVLFISPREIALDYPVVFDSRDRDAIMDETYTIWLVAG